ncbi:hypothetical protein [Xanthomonas phage RTH11]|nr:hypothetical protein [Xanthomonas phage RTH11]
MTIRGYTACLSLPTEESFSSLDYVKLRARSKKDAKAQAEQLALDAKGEMLAVYSDSFANATKRDMRAAHRNINPHLRPAFDLKYRHKGRPIKGRRNVPRPKRGLTITISDFGN